MYRSNLLERMYTSIDIKAGNGASSSGRRPLQGISQYECAVLIGHRGLKMNHRPDESVRENTVHSLREAYTSGAAYVEFDVQVRQLAVSTSNRTRLESNNALSVTALPLTALPVTALTITALPITARAP
eukprot:893708-Pyramimonas_sp.AAC.1